MIGAIAGAEDLPPFEPHPWLRGGHAQTIVGRYWPLPRPSLDSSAHEIALPDGDRLLVLESTPPGWEGTRPTAMLVHGLAGCAEAPYMVRLASHLLAMGIRVVRVNLRGSGRGFGLARGIYHAGRSDDLREVVASVVRLHRRFPELGPPRLQGVRTLYEFDDRYTARRNGFASADDYYRRCSLVTSLGRISIPGLIIQAMDDPFIPHEPLLGATRRPHLELELVRHGGHLGYLSRRTWQGDRRWLDARLAAWLRSRWGPGGS
jgi:predicted alpha/beta-fold hydrolase